MSDRIQKIIEAGEAVRAYDIDLGRNLESERIIALLEAKKDDYYQRNLWADGDGIADAIALIKGENK